MKTKNDVGENMMIRIIKNISIDIALIWLAVSTVLVGFVVTVIGVFLNGWAMFNGSKDL